MMEWFESYLTGRSQYVIYDGIKSETRSVEYCVPRGSILGSTRFMFSMNDICNVSDLMFAIMNADDTVFFNKRHRSAQTYKAIKYCIGLSL